MQCSWCHKDISTDAAPREVEFMGKAFTLCEEDFQLIWRGLKGLKALSEQFKAARVAGAVRK